MKEFYVIKKTVIGNAALKGGKIGDASKNVIVTKKQVSPIDKNLAYLEAKKKIDGCNSKEEAEKIIERLEAPEAEVVETPAKVEEVKETPESSESAPEEAENESAKETGESVSGGAGFPADSKGGKKGGKKK